MNSTRGPTASRLPSKRTAPPWPLMKDSPGCADSMAQPKPSIRVTGTSTDSGL